MSSEQLTPDPGVRILAAQVASLKRRLRDMEQADQMAARSIDDGALEVYDDDDNLRTRIGKQPDGSFAVKAFAPAPETPTEPDVIPVAGGCIVEWDGTFEDAQEEPIQRVAIHVGTTADFEIVTGDEDLLDDDTGNTDEDTTERAAIVSPRGGSAFLALDPGQERYWVRLTAVAEGGAESAPSDAVEVEVAAPEAAFYQDVFTLSSTGAQTVKLTYAPIDHSDHLYWNGLYQREDASWTRLGKVVTLLTTGLPPRAGDVVTVEYAYDPANQPEEPDVETIRAAGPIHPEWEWTVNGDGSRRTTFHPTAGSAGDDDPATYIELSAHDDLFAGSAGSQGMGQFFIEQTALATAANQIAGIEVFVTVSHTSNRSDPNQSGNYFGFGVDYLESEWYLDSPETPMPPDGTPRTFSAAFSLADLQSNDPGLTWADFRTAVADGLLAAAFWFGYTNVEAQTGVVDTFRVHEFWVEVAGG